MTVPLPNRRPSGPLSQWMRGHVPIHQRLALWIVMLAGITLVLFSVIFYTILQTQLVGTINHDVQANAVDIARALGHEAEASQGKSGGPFGGDVTPTPRGGATPTPTSTVAAANSTPTPVPTPNPRTAANIQTTLQVQVPEVLGRLDINFEVLGTDGKPQYLTPALTGIGLPLNVTAIQMGLQGTPTSYRMKGTSSLLEVYVQPIVLVQPAPAPSPSASSTGSAAAATPTTGTGETASNAPRVVGLVLVAEPLDDVNGTLSTVLRILLVGDLGVVLFTYFGGLFIARSGLRPIADLTHAAQRIAANADGPGLGTRVAYRGVQDDVGELVMTFNEMLDAIERVSNAQSRFVADASHELRAPLMTIKGSLELLRRAPDLPEEERRAMTQDAYAEAERMAGLVSDLLLLARVDAVSGGNYGLHEAWLDDQLRSRREPVEVDQLVMNIFRQGRSQLRAKRKDLHLIVSNLEPITVMGDPGQLRQAALILLDNAIKYTPAGGKIRLSATRNGEMAALSVADTGIGIDPQDAEHIFERFYRADRARDRDQHGSGLGLAIAKWLATAHHGDISFTSQPGQGSVFTLRLPALPSTERAADTRPSKATRVAKADAVKVGEPAHGSGMNAIYPLTRLARSVSRPRSEKAGARAEREGRRGDGKSASSARASKSKRG